MEDSTTEEKCLEKLMEIMWFRGPLPEEGRATEIIGAYMRAAFLAGRERQRGRILELEQQLKECQGMLAVYFGDERVYNCIKCDSLFVFDGPPSSDLPLCTSCAELEECQMEIEEARILGRTEAMEWMDILVKRWKNDAKRYKENYPEHSYFYKECADVLDTHIEDFSRTK